MPLFFGFRTKGLCIEVGERKRWFGFVSGFFVFGFETFSVYLCPADFPFVGSTL